MILHKWSLRTVYVVTCTGLTALLEYLILTVTTLLTVLLKNNDLVEYNMHMHMIAILYKLASFDSSPEIKY